MSNVAWWVAVVSTWLLPLISPHVSAQSLWALNDSIELALPDIGDSLKAPLQWKEYSIVDDSNQCISNPRDRYGQRLVILDPASRRVGEIETWSHCCRVILRSIRIDTLLTASSSTHGNYLRATIWNTYDPCHADNDVTSTSFRHWRFKTIHEIRSPLNGLPLSDCDLKDGKGFISTIDTVHRPISHCRMNYFNGYKDGFSYWSAWNKKKGEFELDHIVMYEKGDVRGLYITPHSEQTFVVGYLDWKTGPLGKDRSYPLGTGLPCLKEYFVDKRGRPVEYREYWRGDDVPEFGEIKSLGKKGQQISLCDPQLLVRALFPDAEAERYPTSWDFGADLLGCKKR